MGYTHYWRRVRELDPLNFAAAVADCRKICNALPIPIGDGLGEGEPVFTHELIAFNGHVDSGSFSRDGVGLMWPSEKAEGVATVGQNARGPGNWCGGSYLGSRAVAENGDGSYESFIVEQRVDRDKNQADLKGRYFDCCKTNFRPYDLLVQCSLIALKEHLGDQIRVTSDGSSEQWNEARDGCQVFLGYGLLFELDDKTPDTLPDLPPEPPKPGRGPVDRNGAIKRIRSALKRRSGRDWSVTGGRGTAWGWIRISAPPRRLTDDWEGGPRSADGDYFGYMTLEDRETLGNLLNLGKEAHPQGVSIPASSGHRWEYIDRAEGREPQEFGVQYWD